MKENIPDRVGECVLDATRLDPVRECMVSCGPEYPTDEWDHSCVHPHTVAYGCGRLARPGGPNRHDHEPGEVERCARLAEQAAEFVRGLEINRSEGSSQLRPFFVTANRDDPTPDSIDPGLIRAAFGGTIYPQAEITVAPLEERGWAYDVFVITQDDKGTFPTSGPTVERWRALMNWMKDADQFRDAAFILVGNNPLSDRNFAACFPRLAVALTHTGNLVGVCGHSVQT
jgi:hypothetical protein